MVQPYPLSHHHLYGTLHLSAAPNAAVKPRPAAQHPTGQPGGVREAGSSSAKSSSAAALHLLIPQIVTGQPGVVTRSWTRRGWACWWAHSIYYSYFLTQPTVNSALMPSPRCAKSLQDSPEAYEKLDKARVGVLVGTGMGGLQVFQDGVQNLVEKGHRKISPFFIPYAITNMCVPLHFNWRQQWFT